MTFFLLTLDSSHVRRHQHLITIAIQTSASVAGMHQIWHHGLWLGRHGGPSLSSCDLLAVWPCLKWFLFLLADPQFLPRVWPKLVWQPFGASQQIQRPSTPRPLSFGHGEKKHFEAPCCGWIKMDSTRKQGDMTLWIQPFSCIVVPYCLMGTNETKTSSLNWLAARCFVETCWNFKQHL